MGKYLYKNIEQSSFTKRMWKSQKQREQGRKRL